MTEDDYGMTREQWLAQSKARALKYLDRNDPVQAVASMMSDLSKHSELKEHISLRLAPLHLKHHDYSVDVRYWIENIR